MELKQIEFFFLFATRESNKLEDSNCNDIESNKKQLQGKTTEYIISQLLSKLEGPWLVLVLLSLIGSGAPPSNPLSA